LALFVATGGGLLASKLLGWSTIAAVEIDPFCRAVLFARQQDGDLEPFATWDDVRTFDGKPWRGLVDVVSGGFPCQPFSAAGKRLGADDPRNMWPETARILREVEPRRAFLENVPGLLSSGYFGTVLGDLADMGYRVAWGVLGASTVGARHHRRRLWILADASQGRHKPDATQDGGAVRHAAQGSATAGGWYPEPGVGRVVDGVASRMDRSRIAALGNGQVPICAAVAYLLLCEALEIHDVRD
jgi:DNA (cytosine-5)-methyltransferase 1